MGMVSGDGGVEGAGGTLDALQSSSFFLSSSSALGTGRGGHVHKDRAPRPSPQSRAPNDMNTPSYTRASASANKSTGAGVFIARESAQ